MIAKRIGICEQLPGNHEIIINIDGMIHYQYQGRGNRSCPEELNCLGIDPYSEDVFTETITTGIPVFSRLRLILLKMPEFLSFPSSEFRDDATRLPSSSVLTVASTPAFPPREKTSDAWSRISRGPRLNRMSAAGSKFPKT
jgi:hypothetical protein